MAETRIIIEACVGGVEDAALAVEAGADRLELNAALSLGGITPSLGSIRRALSLSVPVVVMVRPRAGGFVYGARERATMLDDIRVAANSGVSGVAVGVLTPDGAVDAPFLIACRDAAAGIELVFHRAFDVAADLPAALRVLIDIGVDRVLTSGGASTVEAGLPMLGRLQQEAGDAIGVVAGAGVDDVAGLRVIEEAGIRQLHLSCAAPDAAPTPRPGRPDFPAEKAGRSPDVLRSLRSAVDARYHA